MSEQLLCARPLIKALKGEAALARAKQAAADLKAGTAVPFLGPEVFPAEGADIPLTAEGVAAELHKRHPCPGRIRTNMWGVAQFIEQRRHRKMLAAFMLDIFKAGIAPTALHHALAKLKPAMIVDTWYDGAMRQALTEAGIKNWGEVQGITRAVERYAEWYRAFNALGEPTRMEITEGWDTLLYKPHGAIAPGGQVLVADSDYVEVLTEIDIQTPIPDTVKARRENRSFVFVGCRFHDQMLRTYARQIIKRSGGDHVAFVSDTELTNNERRFFEAAGITPIALGADDLAKLLAA